MSQSTRFPPTPTSQLSDDLKPYGHIIEEATSKTFGPNGGIFKYQDSNGAYLGPFPILIASKEVGSKLFDVIKEFRNLATTFPDDAKETVILVVGAKFKCTFERYAHRRIGVKKAGLTLEQVEDLCEGKKPQGLSEKANTAFDVAYNLAFVGGALPDDLWEASVKQFGKDGTLQMSHFIALYCYMCVLLNVSDAKLPPGETMEDK